MKFFNVLEINLVLIFVINVNMFHLVHFFVVRVHFPEVKFVKWSQFVLFNVEYFTGQVPQFVLKLFILTEGVWFDKLIVCEEYTTTTFKVSKSFVKICIATNYMRSYLCA